MSSVVSTLSTGASVEVVAFKPTAVGAARSGPSRSIPLPSWGGAVHIGYAELQLETTKSTSWRSVVMRPNKTLGLLALVLLVGGAFAFVATKMQTPRGALTLRPLLISSPFKATSQSALRSSRPGSNRRADILGW